MNNQTNHFSPADAVESGINACFGIGINSGDRIDALMDILWGPVGVAQNHQPEAAYQIFKAVWPSCDNTSHELDRITKTLKLFKDATINPRDFLEGDDLEWFDKLPDTFTAFRGWPHEFDFNYARIMGVSWTTNREVAEGFAKGHRGLTSKHPHVFEMKVRKDRIFCATNDREEFEIVINPWDMAGV
ncbi:MAG: hypothetical protein ACU0AU_13965 [Cognatishimia activa]